MSRLATFFHLDYVFRFDRLHVYGALAFVHIPPEKRLRSSKFAVRARRGFLVGYSEGQNYHIWIPPINQVVRSTYVIFDERPHVAPIPYTESTSSVESYSSDNDSGYVKVVMPPIDEQIPVNDIVLNRVVEVAIFPPPLGDRSNQEVAEDIQGLPQSDLQRSARSTRGIPPDRFNMVSTPTITFPC